MMRDASMLIKFDEKERGHVMYGDNTRGIILGEGIAGNPSIITIVNVLLIKGLNTTYLTLVNYATNGTLWFFIP